jgi:hypothetical protein
MSTVACVLVYTDEVFKLLDTRSTLAWCIAQLDDVRGIDSVLFFANKSLEARLKTEAPLHALPPPKQGRCVDGNPEVVPWSRTVPELQTADVVVVVQPVQPFLKAAKIEACLLAAQKRGAAFLGRSYTHGCQRETGLVEYAPVMAAVPAVFAFKPAAVADPKWRSKVAVIPVGSIEALDVSDPGDRCLVDAYTLYGN